MIKTIFHTPFEGREIHHADRWYDSKPFKLWFTLYDVLHDSTLNIRRELTHSDLNIENEHRFTTVDSISSAGIIRRIFIQK